MTEVSRPKYKLYIKRKDGREIEFVNYNGETKRSKLAPVLALFEDDKSPSGLSVMAERGGPLDELAKDHWFSIYDDSTRSRKPFNPGGAGNGKGDDGDNIPF